MKTLALALAIALPFPAFGTVSYFKMVARSSNPQATHQIKAGEQFTVITLLWTDDLSPDRVRVSVRYPGIDGDFRILNNDHVTGPATITLNYDKKTGREIALAECQWIYNVSDVGNPSQAVVIQRSEDAATWSTLRVFEDTSTNAFYRWKIEPRE